MSEATLKRKTAHTYKVISSGRQQFSINGIHRNQGFVGQTSLSRTSNLCCKETKDVKSSVISFKGMIQKRTQWARRPAPFSSTKSFENGYSSLHINRIRSNTLKLEKQIKNKVISCPSPAVSCCSKKHVNIVKPYDVKTQREYLHDLTKVCMDNDIKPYGSNTKKCVICGCTNCE